MEEKSATNPPAPAPRPPVSETASLPPPRWRFRAGYVVAVVIAAVFDRRNVLLTVFTEVGRHYVEARAFQQRLAVGLQSISANDWFTAGSRYCSAGPTVQWRIFDAGQTSNQWQR